MLRLKLAALVSLVFIGLLPVRAAYGQTAEGLASVHKLFVAPLKGEFGTSPLHHDLVKHLEAEGKFDIVVSPEQADAVLTGTSQLWVTGYVSVNPRNPSSNAQPNYAGYLSVELVGRNREPLWSYLAVPSRFTLGGIANNLAENAVRALVKARARSASSYTAPSRTVSATHVVLRGAGASFPAPLYRSWIASFHELHPEIDISYEAVGSQSGTQLLADNKLDFAASDIPSSADGTPSSFQRYASVMGGVVPIYNLKGVDRYLRFTPEALAGIYLGRITRWNDAAIRASNKGVHLPDAPILVVHRSDGSGTTYTWSEFLTQTSAAWKSAVGAGATLNWPVGQGELLNEGVASYVASTPNSIGYVELVYAIQHQLSYGAVKNRAGAFVHADLNGLTKAAQGDGPAIDSTAQKSIVNASGRAAYPLTAFTWMLLPRDSPDPERKKAMLAFLEWVLTSGQRSCAALAYAPLPGDVAARELEQLHRSK